MRRRRAPSQSPRAQAHTPTRRAADFNGSDTFTFKASDGKDSSNTAKISLTVTPVNDVPVAVGQSKTTDEDTPVSGTVTATDVDGDKLTFAKVIGPTLGTLVFNSDGTFTYTPNSNKSGSDSFTFTANDGTATSAPATVSITINAVNDAPDAKDDSGTTNADVVLNVPAPGLLGNDSDPEGSAAVDFLGQRFGGQRRQQDPLGLRVFDCQRQRQLHV